MNINKIAGALALISSIAMTNGVAQASTTSYAEFDLGVLTSEGNPSELIPVALDDSFTHKFLFSIENLSEISASVTNNHLLNTGATKITFTWKKEIPDLNMSLFNAGNVQIGNTTTSGVNAVELLSSGSYYALVKGNAIGRFGGAYSISIAAEPAIVPVPAAAWLLGSGLIGMVAVARRKEQA